MRYVVITILDGGLYEEEFDLYEQAMEYMNTVGGCFLVSGTEFYLEEY